MSISHEVGLFLQNIQLCLKPWLMVLGVLWAINIVNWMLGSFMNRYGIYPRKLSGLIGIPLSPILHLNFSHLLMNTVPLFFLVLVLLATQGVIATLWLTLAIAVLGGLGVWLFARKGQHIGASGLISGYFGYILILAYVHPDVTTIITALTALYYFGGLFFGIFPGKKDVSWESHFFGFMSGVLVAYLPLLLTGFVTTYR